MFLHNRCMNTTEDMTDEELWRGYENACKCGSADAVWMKDEIELRLAKRNEKSGKV